MTSYEEQIIELIENNPNDFELGKAIRIWYLENKEFISIDHSDVVDSFSERSIKAKLFDMENGTAYGMK